MYAPRIKFKDRKKLPMRASADIGA